MEQDRYVLALARYIHQNPVKAGKAEKTADYKWSSYSCYLKDDNYFAKMLDTDTILGLFSEDRDVAVKKIEEYMNEECGETFIGLEEEAEVMDEEYARGYKWLSLYLSRYCYRGI